MATGAATAKAGAVSSEAQPASPAAEANAAEASAPGATDKNKK